MIQIPTVTSNLDDTCSTKLPFQTPLCVANWSTQSPMAQFYKSKPWSRSIRALETLAARHPINWPNEQATDGFNLHFVAGMSVKEVRGREVARAKSLKRFDRCFSGLRFSMPIEAGGLKDLDSDKLKAEIKRWAKAVVTYARQVSGYFSSSEGSSSRSSTDMEK